jgi:phage terminase large subunit-like protein
VGRVKKLSRGDENIRWIERHCRLPEGPNVGKKVKLQEWQRDIIRRIYNNRVPTRRALVSFGRKNAKTTLAAFLLLLHLCGREKRFNSQLFSTAQSKEQAGVLFDLAAKIVRMSAELRSVVVVRDTYKQLFCPELGTLYRALSAEVKTSYGLSPVFVVHDELGQCKGNRSELYEALETATGVQQNPLSIVISTQARTDADLLSVLIDDALAGYDPRTVVAQYRNLVLNQRVEASSPFVSRSLWQTCNAAPLPIEGVPVYGGLDLSEVKDLTALVLVGNVDGVWHVHPTFWLPADGLADKARTDRVPYDQWQRQGALIAAPGKSIDYEYVSMWLREIFERYTVAKIAFDRWNFKHLKPWLLRAGFTEQEIEAQFVEFGQGFQSMSPALRELEAEILNGRLAHGDHPVLSMCAGNAVLQTDPSGNRKLTKAKSSGRIDGMVALTMAIGAAAAEATVEIDVRAMIG